MFGCGTTNKEYDYLGTVPSYAVWQPPFEGAERQTSCACCKDGYIDPRWHNLHLQTK